MFLQTGGFAVSASVFCFWVDGCSPDVLPSSVPIRLRIEFEEAIDHAKAQHNARRKIVREDADRRRPIDGLEQTVVHLGKELLSYVASWPSGRAFREPTAGASCRVGSKRNGRRRQSYPRICRQSETGVALPAGVLRPG